MVDLKMQTNSNLLRRYLMSSKQHFLSEQRFSFTFVSRQTWQLYVDSSKLMLKTDKQEYSQIVIVLCTRISPWPDWFYQRENIERIWGFLWGELLIFVNLSQSVWNFSSHEIKFASCHNRTKTLFLLLRIIWLCIRLKAHIMAFTSSYGSRRQ